MPLRYIAAFSAVALLVSAPVHAAFLTYVTTMSGPNESPPNASPGTGVANVFIDDVAHTMRVVATFSGLQGTTTNCHIHGPTTTAFTGTAGVMTRTPTFLNFPSGVTSGSYDHTYDLTQAGSFNPAFVTANGGSVPAARAAFYQAMADGKAYFNIHSNVYPGGEIRGFMQIGTPTPTATQSWGRIKQLYR